MSVGDLVLRILPASSLDDPVTRRPQRNKRTETAMATRGRPRERVSEGKGKPEQFRGWLLKWTNYIKGYQKRWFVLNNGLLSYYRLADARVILCEPSRDACTPVSARLMRI